MAFKVFQDGTSLTAEDLNDVIVEQAVITFADAAARDNAIPTPNVGQHCFLVTTGETYKYTASGWVALIGDKLSGLTARPTIVCTSTTRPAHAEGRFIYETDTKWTYVSGGGGWIRLGGYKPWARIHLASTSDLPLAANVDHVISNSMAPFSAALDPYGMWDATNKKLVLPFAGIWRLGLNIGVTGVAGAVTVARITNGTTIGSSIVSDSRSVAAANEHYSNPQAMHVVSSANTGVQVLYWSNQAFTVKYQLNGALTTLTAEYVGPQAATV